MTAAAKHVNIPVFVTHNGCKNDCVFCNQRIITGENTSEPVSAVKEKCEKYLAENADNGKTAEIAFFGGSFTGIERGLMLEYLSEAKKYTEISGGKISGIRLSTRPDYIDGEILSLLKVYGVTHIELGIQSTDDSVLVKCRRGHTAKEALAAMRKVKENRFALTGQMMLGLPGADSSADRATAKAIAGCNADCARIYPTVIFQGTELFEMYKRGEYIPLTLEQAVSRAAAAKKIFDDAEIPVIRLGLCASDNMGDISKHIGPYHPAFGELTENAIYFERLCSIIEKKLNRAPLPQNAKIEIKCRLGERSKVAGHKNINLNRLREIYRAPVKIKEYDGALSVGIVFGEARR